MIDVIGHPWRNKDQLNKILSAHPDHVFITDATVVPTGESWEGYADKVKYGFPVVTKHHKKPYSFRKETSGKVRCF